MKGLVWGTGQALLRSPRGRNASRDGLVKLGWVHCLQYTLNCFQYNVCGLCRCELSNQHLALYMDRHLRSIAIMVEVTSRHMECILTWITVGCLQLRHMVIELGLHSICRLSKQFRAIKKLKTSGFISSSDSFPKQFFSTCILIGTTTRWQVNLLS